MDRDTYRIDKVVVLVRRSTQPRRPQPGQEPVAVLGPASLDDLLATDESPFRQAAFASR
ncbi:hypothetical protein [Halomicrococcus gelatinilyticus]|uniref:hypothetical protein n=1 Tax=Halomicrococcus gelatinilyticus TaxID=1702103 RepID=UPI002E154A59